MSIEKADQLPTIDVPGLLRQHGLRLSKSLGQHFLTDENILARIVAAAEIQPEQAVLEVGAGLGTLTRHLARAAQRVVAVELDAKFLPALNSVLALFDNVELIQADILELDPADLFPSDNFIVVANIPYYITSALLRHLLESANPPQRLVLTVQREVAGRICAQPPDMSLLALSVQVYGRPQVVHTIPAGAFYPPPKVDSAVVRVDLYPQPLLDQTQIERFFQLTKAGFGQKRKTLRNALSAGLPMPKDEVGQRLAAAGVDPKRRAQTLNLEEWGQLVAAF